MNSLPTVILTKRQAGPGITMGVVIVSCGWGAAPAHAELLTYEQFLYPASVISINGLGGGQGWGGPWSGNHLIDPAIGLETVYNPYPLPGGLPTAVVAMPRGGHALNPCESQSSGYGRVSTRLLARPINMAHDGVWYFSFLMRRDTVATDCSGYHTAYNNMRVALAFLAGGSHPVNDAQISFGSDLQSLGGSNSFEVILKGTPEPGSEFADDTIVNETTFQIVGKVVSSASTYDQVFFERYQPGKAVDPADPEWDKFSRPAMNNSLIDRICLYGQAAHAVDEIRIGTSWDSVTGEAPPAVCTSFAPPDFDFDCDVDADDLGRFTACALGPMIAQNAAACQGARLDGDPDVDLDDFGVFQRCYSGAGRAADPGCAD